MTRAPHWSREEFNLLLQYPHTSSETLTQQLPRRTVRAIEVVRQGVHSSHRGNTVSMLSQMMIRRLQAQQGMVVCPVCRDTF